jgi:hypothetical protein
MKIRSSTDSGGWDNAETGANHKPLIRDRRLNRCGGLVTKGGCRGRFFG